VDWLVLAFIALQAVLLAVVLNAALSRGRALDAVREIVETPAGSDDVLPGVRRLHDRAATAEWALDQERRNARYLADQISVGIVRIDDDQRIDMANTAAHVFLDRPARSMLGLTAIEAFVDGRIEDLVDRARESGAASGELALGGPDGRTVIVRARRSPVGGVWVVVEDVSELRRLQQIRQEFIDNLSHELRTPLTTISLLAETLARDAAAAGEGVPVPMRERIGKVEVETGNLVQMVNEMLDLARIEGGPAAVHLDDVDLGRLAETSTERLTLFAERQGVELSVEVAPDLPVVRGDEARLGQVLVNLVHNAVKFSPDGGEVIVRVRRDGAEVVTSVTDHGIGIPRAALPRVFERFYKVDRTRARGGGTGLGLAISRHVLNQHGGRIWVTSEEDVGSTFSFALPIADHAT
jgi:two-component system phosphate regulon sensor histidine kinase PhoR